MDPHPSAVSARAQTPDLYEQIRELQTALRQDILWACGYRKYGDGPRLVARVFTTKQHSDSSSP